ncbi:unnamed protein product, partial [Hymenolepis diminuta]
MNIITFKTSLPTRIWPKVIKLEHIILRRPKSTEGPKITVRRSRILRANTRIQREDCNSYGHKEGFCQRSQRRPYTDHKRGQHQNQNRQAHDVLTTMQVNIDTGSDVTIVSREAWKSLGRPKLDRVPFKVSSALVDAVQLS